MINDKTWAFYVNGLIRLLVNLFIAMNIWIQNLFATCFCFEILMCILLSMIWLVFSMKSFSFIIKTFLLLIFLSFDICRLLARNSRMKRKCYHCKWNPLLFDSHFMVQGSHHVFGEKCNSILRNKINDDNLV